jgi:hypothetical protein
MSGCKRPHKIPFGRISRGEIISPQTFERRLSVTLSEDITGCSRRMGEDVAATVKIH